MYQCPVCGRASSTLLCSNCGFDGSCNYEAYPSLKALSAQIPSIRARKADLAEREKDLLRCPACGSTSLSVDRSLQCTCGSCRHRFSLQPPAKKTERAGKAEAAEKKEPLKQDPSRSKTVENYLAGLGVVEKIQQEQTAQAAQKPPVSPRPAPKPKDGKKTAARLLIAALLILGVVGGAAVLLRKDSKPSLDVNTLPISEAIKTLVAAGTEDTYTYVDGSRLEQYFDDSGLEAARIYMDKSGEIEYVFAAEYDGSENMTEQLTFDGTGALIRTDSFTRNPDGEWTEHRITLKDGASGGKYQRTFTPDGGIELYAEWAADGTLVEETRNFFAEEGGYTGCTYLDGSSEQYTEDKDGTAWSTMLDADGKITGKTEFRHDENGICTGTYYYDAEGALLNWNEWVYNAQGQVTKRTDFNADGTVDGIYEYDYNAEGKETATRIYDANGTQEQETITILSSGGTDVGTVNTGYGENASTDRYEYVESITGTIHKSFSQNRSDGYYGNAVSDYNVLGLRESYISCDQNGRPTYEVHYSYDAGGNQVEELTISRSYDSSGRLSYENETTTDAQGNSTGTGKSYNEDGKLEYTTEQETTHDADGNALETSKTYDAEGRLTEEHTLTREPNGNYVSHDKSYDEDGKLTGSSTSGHFRPSNYTVLGYADYYKSYDKNGTLTYESFQQTDPLGNSTETRKHYDPDGSLSQTTESRREYNEDGSFVRTETTCDGQGRVTETVDITYNADSDPVSGQRISTTYYDDGRKTVTTYDHNYDLISREEYDASGRLISGE